MFFFLSKAIDFLAMPLSMILVFLIYGFFTKNRMRGKWAIGLAILALYFTSNTFLVKKVLNWWEPKVTLMRQINGSYDVGILLSGGLIAGSKPYSDLVSLGNNGDRVLQTFRLYKAGKIKKILITGASFPYQMDLRKGETREAAALLVQWGVPASDIMFEEKAKNTRENAKYSAAILKQKFPAGKYILITSAFHMRRAQECFKKAGVDVLTFPADYHGGYNNLLLKTLLIPDANAFANFSVLWHELVGYIVYRIAGYT